MIINQKVFVAVIAILSTTIESANVDENKNVCKSRDELDAKCGPYTYSIVKPMMEYFAKITKDIELKDKKIAELESKTLSGDIAPQPKSDEKSELELREENTKLKDSLTMKQAEIATLQTDLTHFKNNLDEKNNENKKCELLVADNKNKILQLEKTHEDHLKINKQQIGELTKKYEICKTDLENLGIKNTILDYKLASCEKNALVIEKTAKESSVLLNEYKQRIANLTDTVSNQSNTIGQKPKKSENIAQCEKYLFAKDFELSSLQNKLVECKKSLEYLPKSCDRCKDYSGRATVEVNGLSPFTVSCDSNIAGSGWTVIQRRIDGKVGFYRNWDEYKHGFGDFNREFWIGLQKLHKMTNEKRYELYIHLIDQDNEQRYARYDNFKIGSEDTNFKLISLGTHTGNTRDSMRYHEGEPFSTYDRDNDFSSDNCATILKGGWWYWNCAFSNLNGQNFSCKMEESKQLENIGCIYWQDWHGRSYSMKFVQMMIRPI